MRNPDTEWCVSHHQLAKGVNLGNGAWTGGCKKRVALTATPVFNKPLDMVGLCKAINSAPEFQDKRYWSLDRQCKTINPATVKLWQKHTDRVKDDILNLPAIHQYTHSFDANLSADEAAQYNTHLQKAQRLKMAMDAAGKITTQDLQRLMLLLQRMQQMLISPRLAEKGAEYFKKNPIEVANAAQVETGALVSLHQRILTLQSEGHERVMVACCHVTLMQIARRYLQDQGAQGDGERSVGTIFIYDGTLSLPQRQAERIAFLNADRAVLFLSIGAGGTGLHLVPQKPGTPIGGFCRSVIFWGSRPFSPQQVWQTLKRIHRIGQKYEVHVHHMIAHGSVDYAINCVHADKSGLADAIVDDDWSNCDEVGGNWRRTGKIVLQCVEMMVDGCFPSAEAMQGLVPMPAESAPINWQELDPSRDAQQRLAQMHAERAQQGLTSQFFRQPLQAAAAGSSSAPPQMVPMVPLVRGVAVPQPVARNRPGFAAAHHPRVLPAPRVAPMPFGPPVIDLEPEEVDKKVASFGGQGVLPAM